ncbi:MAG: phosphoserine phosphatase SerB [Alcaligenaceae bacterium]|nr:phosphoserine phosphatase SerB [Alcaligenaceae bacterium]
MTYLVLQSPILDSQLREQIAAIAEADQVIQVRNHVIRLNGFNESQLPEIKSWCAQHKVDWAILDELRSLSDIKILAMDMDSTLINIECVDEIAGCAGRKTEVAEITEATMRGEIKNFSESLIKRVALLEGTSANCLQTIYSDILCLNPGAEALIESAQKHGITTLLVSGGFTFFTSRLKERLKLDYAYANQLEVLDNKLSGRVLGDILDGEAKQNYLSALMEQLDASPEQCIAIGDGSNDLPMMSKVHYSVAYMAKPKVQEEARFSINHSGLDAVLNFFED